jgi:hypothetical protein
MAGETHFLFGDDRFVPWGAEFERAAARDGVQPQDLVTVAQVRSWLDAIRPELGLCDEVSDLIVLAWAALRQRAWYLHGSSIPAPRPGAARPDMQLQPEPLPVPADWQVATSRAEVLFGIRVNPYLTAANVAEFTESLRGKLDVLADPAATLVARVELTYQHLTLATDQGSRLATARASADLVESLRRASSRVHLVEVLAKSSLPATDIAVANSLIRAEPVATEIAAFRWDRLGPLRAAEDQPDERGQSAARALRTLREAVAADEFTTRLGPVLSKTDDAIFDWLSAGQPTQKVEPPKVRRPDDVPIQVPSRSPTGRAGQATRAKGGPASEVIEPLTAFLNAHRDEQVVVEWWVQE